MKKIKNLSKLMFAALLAVLISSCLNEDNDPQQKIDVKYYKYVSGNYTGKVEYFTGKDNKERKTEEGVKIAVTPDSTMKITGIPAAVFAKNISDEKIRTAINAQPNPEFSVRFLIYSIGSKGISMFVQPLPIDFKGIMVDGKKHDYTINFHVPSFAFSTPSYKNLSLTAFMGKLLEDGKEKENFIPYSKDINESVTIYIDGNRDSK